ncbi:response regulator [Halalkalibacter sp. APA_J-10(15)]|uniref:response regulator n=1 Tax=Halalkalibacter sp. APA_J-10(15) TaxID=2933805 RepID=UPI001FF5E01D|nr:response regulator [Halalkalibacter sp. APA_J-10(15)]MCK0470111.1 response regulator [Halalkalibacter sp. APA_J-10(15)]
MYKAILIDDEKLSLERLKKLIQDVSDTVDVIGEYVSPLVALEDIQYQTPDIIFLDIHMSEMNGLEFASRIQEKYSNIHIVFVTGYDSYAIEAFELFVLDYLLKPIHPERLKKTLERLGLPHKRYDWNSRKSEIYISCFQEITFYKDKDEEITIKWRTKKTLELFAYLLHHRNKFVAKDTLIELLWSDFPVKQSYQQLYTAIYHCRNALIKANVGDIMIKSVNKMNAGYILETGESITLETDEWDFWINRFSSLTHTDLPQYKKMFDQYKGDYYGSYYFHWASDEIESRRQQWLQLARLLADYYLQQQRVQEAIEIYYTVQQRCPYIEDSYVELMKLHAMLQQHIAVENQYHKLKATLRREFEIEPNEEIRKWYDQWKLNKVRIR